MRILRSLFGFTFTTAGRFNNVGPREALACVPFVEPKLLLFTQEACYCEAVVRYALQASAVLVRRRFCRRRLRLRRLGGFQGEASASVLCCSTVTNAFLHFMPCHYFLFVPVECAVSS